MLANFQIVGSNAVPHPAHPVLLLALSSCLCTHHLTIGYRVSEETLFLLAVVHTERRANGKVLQWRNAQMHVTKHTPQRKLVVLGIADHA